VHYMLCVILSVERSLRLFFPGSHAQSASVAAPIAGPCAPGAGGCFYGTTVCDLCLHRGMSRAAVERHYSLVATSCSYIDVNLFADGRPTGVARGPCPAPELPKR
jgi:hypothetical protein